MGGVSYPCAAQFYILYISKYAERCLTLKRIVQMRLYLFEAIKGPHISSPQFARKEKLELLNNTYTTLL